MERVYLQSDNIADQVQYKGSLAEWKNELATLARGNSRAILAICLGFAAPLSPILELPTVCFNFRGCSSIGKTVLLHLAVSVNGTQVQTWRSTDNAFEMLAASSNHRLLVIDELGQAAPRTVGESIYMFANERGKRRLTSTITSRPVLTWNMMVLSSSEVTLGDLLAEAGKQVKAGQEARFIDIPADAGCGFGVWEDLHGFKNGAQFSDEVRRLAKENMGYAGRQFLTQMVHWQDELPDEWRKFREIFMHEITPKGSDGQVLRVLERFAQVAFAGEKATQWGITGWKGGEAREGIIDVAKAWLDSRGSTTSKEEQQAIELIRTYIEHDAPSQMDYVVRQNGRLMLDVSNSTVRNRTGFIDKLPSTDEDDEPDRLVNHYYFLPQAWRKHVCKGMDANYIAKVLAKNGFLKKSTDGKYQCKMTLPSLPRQRIYHVLPHIMDDN